MGEDPDRQIRTSTFQLDRVERQSDLVRLARLVDVESEYIPWTARMNPSAVRALYASLIHIRLMPAAARQRALDALEGIAAHEFRGSVERPFVTVLYTGRRPRGGPVHTNGGL